jgi:hypothetical protein
MPMSRRQTPRLQFAGVALATVRIDFFRSFYESFGIGDKGAISLTSDDGRLIVRRPFSEKDIGADIAAGPLFQLWRENGETASAIHTSEIDFERLFTYRHVRTYPLLVMVALSKEEVLERWRTRMVASAAGILVLLAVLLLLGTRMIRQLIERDRLQAELREAKTALEANNASLKRRARPQPGSDTPALFRPAPGRRIRWRWRTVVALVMIDVDYFKR